MPCRDIMGVKLLGSPWTLIRSLRMSQKRVEDCQRKKNGLLLLKQTCVKTATLTLLYKKRVIATISDTDNAWFKFTSNPIRRNWKSVKSWDCGLFPMNGNATLVFKQLSKCQLAVRLLRIHVGPTNMQRVVYIELHSTKEASS